MELKVNMDVSAPEFFDVLEESIIYDIKESTNKTITRDKIRKGYSYNKTLKTRLGKDGKVRVTIKDFNDSKYVASFLSSQGENIVSYEVEELDDKSLNVKYTEEFIDDSTMKKANFSIMSFIFKRGNKKRGYRSLKQIENVIISNRGRKEID